MESSLDGFPSPLHEETIDHCVSLWDEALNGVIYDVDDAVWQTRQ